MSDYENEIDKMMAFLKDDPETLRTILRNYDWLVKRNSEQQGLPLPYWCYCCCGSESLEEIVKSGGVENG